MFRLIFLWLKKGTKNARDYNDRTMRSLEVHGENLNLKNINKWVGYMLESSELFPWSQ